MAPCKYQPKRKINNSKDPELQQTQVQKCRAPVEPEAQHLEQQTGHIYVYICEGLHAAWIHAVCLHAAVHAMWWDGYLPTTQDHITQKQKGRQPPPLIEGPYYPAGFQTGS